jgi:nicotinate-nucleotide--dimethylbenzimidazole phosphoribosyltransferase
VPRPRSASDLPDLDVLLLGLEPGRSLDAEIAAYEERASPIEEPAEAQAEMQTTPTAEPEPVAAAPAAHEPEPEPVAAAPAAPEPEPEPVAAAPAAPVVQLPTQPSDLAAAAVAPAAERPAAGRSPLELLPPVLGERRVEVGAPAQHVLTPVGARTCPSCGLSLSVSARFCRRCGTAQQQAG